MKKRQKLIIFAGIIVIVAGASAGLAFFLSQQKAPDEQSSDTSVVQPASPAEKKSKEAEKIALNGDVPSGVKALEEAIKGTSDMNEKYIYYSNLATILLNDGKYDEALSAAKSAYELKKSSDSAALVGQVAREKGNKTEALDYYKKAIAAIDPADPFSDEDKKYYEEMIAEIEGGR